MERIYREVLVKITTKSGIVTIQLGQNTYALTEEQTIELRDALTHHHSWNNAHLRPPPQWFVIQNTSRPSASINSPYRDASGNILEAPCSHSKTSDAAACI